MDFTENEEEYEHWTHIERRVPFQVSFFLTVKIFHLKSIDKLGILNLDC